MLTHTPIRSRYVRSAQRPAFTLLEILVVLAIIVMLAGSASYFIIQHFKDSKLDVARIGIKKIDDAVNAYMLKNKNYPQRLGDLTSEGENGGPYLSGKELVDPWEKEYTYDVNGPQNKGRKPDISTVPPGKTNPIGNWE